MVLSVSYFSFTVILSVLSGLENYSLQFSKSFDPEIKVSQKNNQLIILDDSDLDFLSKHENYAAKICLLYTSPSPRDRTRSRMPSSA